MSESVLISFASLCLLVVIGKWLRVKVRLFHRLYLPASVIAGLLGLLLNTLPFVRMPASWTAGWSTLPGILINVVFATLFLGATIPSPRQAWRRAGAQLAYGQIVAWGQYVVGLGLVLALLGPLFGVPPLFGVLVPVGFEGGHGTAAGLRGTFEQLGWMEGGDLALTAATIGILSAILTGIVLINWAARRGILREVRPLSEMDEVALSGMYPVSERPPAGRQTVRPDSLDTLAFHLAVIGVAVLIGILLQRGLALGLGWTGHPAAIQIGAAFPLFPLSMLGGIATQVAFQRFSRIQPVDAGLMQRCGGTAMDFLVVAAISTINLQVVGAALAPILIIAVAGIAWNVFCVVWLARRMLPDAWFERAICEMGQSMGVTATGLLLLRIADPDTRTPAREAFGYKQLLHEPFMGGGLWTSTAVPLVVTLGGAPVFGIAVAVMIGWLMVLGWGMRGGARSGVDASRR